jgi:hypothetical protein
MSTPGEHGLPHVRDEAADTPMWVPLLGIVLLLAVAAIVGVRAWGDDDGENADIEIQVPELAPPAPKPE